LLQIKSKPGETKFKITLPKRIREEE